MAEPLGELQAIDSLLPHSGAMCLLQCVHQWDDQSIECRTETHLDSANPLRVADRLPVEAGIEYVAQAMAIHGSLGEQRQGQPRIGYLAVLSKVDWFCDRLDDLSGELRVCAQKQAASEGGFCYSFSLHHRDKVLLEGQAIVALQDR